MRTLWNAAIAASGLLMLFTPLSAGEACPGEVQNRGLSEALSSELERLARAEIAADLSPGIAIAVGDASGLKWMGTFGRVDGGETARCVTRSTRFDLASLTKPLISTIALKLHGRGTVDLTARVGDVIGDTIGARYSPNLRIWHLLSHRSGLPAGSARPYPERARVDYWLAAEHRPAPPGESEIYSDLGMLLLGSVLERASGHDLRTLFHQELATPLDLTNSGFGPYDDDDVVATERIASEGIARRGVVHDPLARALGGVAAHAGLFMSIGDLARFAQHVTSRRVPGICSALQEAATRRLPGGSFTLGWDTPTAGRLPSVAGDFLSSETFGHTGFTGTSLWVDPGLDGLYVAILTSRLNPPAKGNRHRSYFRQVHDMVATSWKHASRRYDVRPERPLPGRLDPSWHPRLPACG